MIKAKQKPIEEIMDAIGEYTRVLNIGCGGCVSVCLAGGQKEVQTLNTDINRRYKNENKPNRLDAYTVERQCNLKYFEGLDALVADYDCLVSMACGAGVQLLAERFPEKP
ncbi:MAG: hypothetical protein JRH15_00645, partial [Deltaproteobacteria bacterium]|nr:hypothetical protein [Deltaproteobacteria bacterium]